MNKHLMQLTLDMIDFFANCDDDLVDPDVSVAKLEEIAFLLQQLSTRERNQFAKFVEQAAESNEEKSEFYRSVPENIGLFS
ncbi:hypothetical protein Mal15_50220 [Stieleria maiorica]|uniref:Uncharacterized protein n=1 Tax=Stieleria maiorica TaxID=2795974 RepID=A0A5B9MN18_9BACT|nr:hypothetical protein [Stieleria maiorica]QEG00946.1 hypothetical protein Mal15_50220 [Stieleria maiorica]